MAVESLLAKMSPALAKTVGEAVKPFLSEFKDEIAHFLDDGLEPYLGKQQTRYSEVKTLLHRHKPVNLYDIYQPLKLRYKYNTVVQTDSINRVFWETQFVTVIGEAGSGKSTLLKHLFLNAIKEGFGIPILIELRYLNTYEKSIDSFIKEKVFENKLSPNGKMLERLLEDGRFVFFLDGFDEINSASKESTVASLNKFINVYIRNRFLLTSRPYSNVELLPLFHNYHIENLSEQDIKNFINKQVKETELAGKIIQSIEENENNYIRNFLKNPLLLSLFIIAFQSNASIPDKKYIFYRRVVDTLFAEHDSISKVGFERERLCKLSQEQVEDILKKFSFLSYFDGKYDFDRGYLNSKLTRIKESINISFDNNSFIQDLKSAIALWVEDGGILSFAHRSIQEYFAVLHIDSLSASSKEKAYQKIRDKISMGRGEKDNFLSLCQELDTVNFHKFLSLPILKEIKNNIPQDSIYQKIRATVLTNSMSHILPKDCSSIVGWGHNIHSNRYDYFLYDIEEAFLHRFDSLILSDQLIRVMLDKGFFKNVIFLGESLELNYDESLNEELIEYLLQHTNIEEIVDEFITNLDNLIKETEQFIAQHKKAEEDLIDLI